MINRKARILFLFILFSSTPLYAVGDSIGAIGMLGGFLVILGVYSLFVTLLISISKAKNKGALIGLTILTSPFIAWLILKAIG